MPDDAEAHLSDPDFVDSLEANYEHCVKTGIMKKCFDTIANKYSFYMKLQNRLTLDGLMKSE